MSKLSEHYTPTVIQSAIGTPLRSEQRTNEFLPRVLSRVDMLAIFIVIVLFIPNASVVQATQGAGIITYFYWILGTITFLIPGAIITGQLNRFMPSNGGIYVWTDRALGPLSGFFAGFCAWFPGVLVLLSAGSTILSLIQGIGIQVAGPHADWLAQPWQQGFLVLAALFVGAYLATIRLPTLMKATKIIVVLYCLGIFTVGLAGCVWLLTGHAAQVSPTSLQLPSGSTHFALYGLIILALLGVEVPFNMAAETQRPQAVSLFLRRGWLLILICYLLGTFGVMVVVPSQAASQTYSTLTAVSTVFGAPLAVIVGLSFIAFFIIVITLYSVCFARILFAAALDQRLPGKLTRLNRHGTPAYATTLQTIIVLALALFTYFLGPLIYPDQHANFPIQVYDVSQATVTVIWCISMIILFLDLPILLQRYQNIFARFRDQLIAPLWLLYLCSIVGCLGSILGIWTTLSSSWDTSLIPDNQWVIAVSISSVSLLTLGLIAAAYPRLLSSLKEQTSIARENARLYTELHQAYMKLSELDQLKDAFLTTASHELRTPLTIVQGYLELLGEMEDIDPQLRQTFLNKARRACDELVLLQANIMDASRIDIDKAVLQCSEVSLHEICQSMIELFEPIIIQEKRAVDIDVDASLLAWADETRLKQILRNLLSNAMRYSPRESPVRITATTQSDGQYIRINIIDRGPGIPLDKHALIFERFVRLERDMHGNIRGCGLGLSITRQLVEAMQGTITVESSGIKGEGSTFSFTLPVAKNALIPASHIERSS